MVCVPPGSVATETTPVVSSTLISPVNVPRLLDDGVHSSLSTAAASWIVSLPFRRPFDFEKSSRRGVSRHGDIQSICNARTTVARKDDCAPQLATMSAVTLPVELMFELSAIYGLAE
jgi:hypothetical protein